MKSLILFLVLNLLSLVSYAQRVVISDPDQTYYPFHLSTVLEVQPGSVTIDSLLQHPDHYRFRAQNSGQYPNGNHEYWLRIELINQLNAQLYLWSDIPLIVPNVVYQIADGRLLQTIHYRDGITDTANGHLQHRRAYALHKVPNKRCTLYIKISGEYYSTITFVAVATTDRLLVSLHHQDMFFGLYYGLVLLISLYSLSLFVRLREWESLLYTVWILILSITTAISFGLLAEWSLPLYKLLFIYLINLFGLAPILYMGFAIHFLQVRQRSQGMYRASIFILVFMVGSLIYSIYSPNWGINLGLGLIQVLYSLVMSILAIRQNFKPAWYFLFGAITYYLISLVQIVCVTLTIPLTFWSLNSAPIASALEILFFTFGLTYKVNLLKKHQDEAIQQQLRLTKENEQLVESQNRVLEEKVEQRTAELRASQAQLIQKEKLASLGELTAGIAHEIQNPLNFVNNFSEVSTELVTELEDEQKKPNRDIELESEILGDLKQNLEKITHHGQRASSIVRGMLEHSRTSTGEKAPTDLNALADEYLRLAYHGLRAKSKDFSADLKTEFDPNLSLVNVAPQELGRVLLNLYNNAFYAVQQRVKLAEPDYQPSVRVSTRQEPGRLVIRVHDNGIGIPDTIQAKIFQPFFTTKPTGEGTGLGLSLSYDIITKGHGGTLDVLTETFLFTEFIVTLPTHPTP